MDLKECEELKGVNAKLDRLWTSQKQRVIVSTTLLL
jgi:hypothetical protein